MSGIKIINVLRGDTQEEILEHVRQAPAGEIIFVLPRTGKLFRSADHFATFAAEAREGGKTLSILSTDAGINAMARAHGFTVMSAGRAKPAAALAASVPPMDDDIQDPNQDAFDRSVPLTSDETMDTSAPDEAADSLDGYQIQDAEGNPVEEAPADAAEAAEAADTAAPAVVPEATLASATVDGMTVASRHSVPVPHKPEKAKPVPVQTTGAELDYIDAMWRDKVAQAPEATPKAHRSAAASAAHVSKRTVTGILVASLAILGAAIYLTAGSASVVITPISEPLDVKVDVQASDTFSAVDPNFGKIPGQLVQLSKTGSGRETATGQRDVASKARGSLVVHNEYSSTPQALVATTRFVNEQGQVFRTLQSVTVPGSTVQAGVAVGGTVKVDVIADKPGSEFNAAAGRWTVAAFQERGDTDRTQKIYGVSAEAMSGGASGPSTVVTQADYDKAYAAAVADAEAQIEASLSENTGLRVLAEVEPVISATTPSARADDAAAEVSISVTATLKTIAFRQADLDRVIVEATLKREHRDVLPDQLELSYGGVSFDAATNVLSFAVTIRGPGYTPVDTSTVLADLRGKSSQDVRTYFSGMEGVQSASLSLRPFWVRTVPDKDSRIHVDVQRKAESR